MFRKFVFLVLFFIVECKIVFFGRGILSFSKYVSKGFFVSLNLRLILDIREIWCNCCIVRNLKNNLYCKEDVRFNWVD